MYVCTCCINDSPEVKDGTGNDVRVLHNLIQTLILWDGSWSHSTVSKWHGMQHEYRYFNHAIHVDQCGTGCI